MLLDLSGHPLLGRYRVTRYRTILIYKFHVRVEGDMLDIPHRLKMKHFNSL